MGLRATIHLIHAKAYDAAVEGRLDEYFAFEGQPSLNLDKAWHAIHFLIIGSTEMTFLSGGFQLDGVDEHYEVHSPQSIQDLHANLKGQSATDLISRMGINELNRHQIYPYPWDDIGIEYVETYLQRFLECLDYAAKMNLGFTVVIA